MSDNNVNNNMSDDAIQAIKRVAEEAFLYQQEYNLMGYRMARRKLDGNASSFFNVLQDQKSQESQPLHIDDSDNIRVLGRRNSLMLIAKTFAFHLYQMGYEHASSYQKHVAELFINSIIDLIDTRSFTVLDMSDESIADLISRFSFSQPAITPVNNDLQTIYNESENDEVENKFKYYMRKSLDWEGDYRKKLELAAQFHKIINYKKGDLKTWTTMSEWSVIIKFWDNIFEIIFEETGIILIWGDTKNDVFKVDLRLCVKYENKLYDISNIEFKKTGKDSEAVLDDESKVLIEAKTILNNIICTKNLNLEEAKAEKAVVVQVCGLRAVFKQLKVVAAGAYFAGKYGNTIILPTSSDKFKEFMESGMQQLFVFKEHILEEANKLETCLMQNRDALGSQSTIEDQEFTKEVYRIPKSAKSFPPLPVDFYKYN